MWHVAMQKEVLTHLKDTSPKRNLTQEVFREPLKAFLITQCDDPYLHLILMGSRVGATEPFPLAKLLLPNDQFDRVLTRRKPK